MKIYLDVGAGTGGEAFLRTDYPLDLWSWNV